MVVDDCVAKYVTTSYEPSTQLELETKALSHRLGIPYLQRIKVMKDGLISHPHLVMSREGLEFRWHDGRLHFHPSMAMVRYRRMIRAESDRMVTAMDISEGMAVLDCTLGLASDALIASAVVGKMGVVVGLESSPVLAEIVRHGLSSYSAREQGLVEAARRIDVIGEDHMTFLTSCPSKAFDVVYFDPMFRAPVGSPSMKPLRGITNNKAIDPEAVEQAVRVARHRVVLKESKGSLEFERLGFSVIPGSMNSEVSYGVIFIS